jgi:heat shock protein HslJ
MRKLFILLFFIILQSAYSQESKDFNDGYDFVGIGTEPFWDVKINETKEISFHTISDGTAFSTGIPELTLLSSNDVCSYSAESDKYSVKVLIKKEECTDGMSDNIYQYSVNVSVTEKSSNQTKEFKGCGYYTNDYRLDDIWVLDKLKGNEFSKKDYSTRPYMELKVRDSRVGGNAGCNTFLGKIEIKGHKIAFSKNMNMTKMACEEMKLEMDFINAISGKTLGYKVDNGKLYFYENGNTVMQFYRTD